MTAARPSLRARLAAWLDRWGGLLPLLVAEFVVWLGFGGLLPATAFAIVASTGDIYAGLWYPVIFAAITVVVGVFFLPETKDRDIH